MGLDEALLRSARAGAATLRLYTWDGPWLSLGYGQSADSLRVARCHAAGVGLVRRATGGAAVLHGSDLTYAVAAPASALPPGLAGAYRLVSAALVEALRGVGVDAWRSVAQRARAPERPFDCFLEPAADEICAGPLPNRKLVGSAQRRVGGALLQHGSIRLAPDPPSTVSAAGLSLGAATSLGELGCSADKEEVGRRLARALAGLLGLPLEADETSPAERECALARMRSHSSDPLALPAPLGELPSRGLSAGR
jgi:lipoyl(octanoyl) transferase